MTDPLLPRRRQNVGRGIEDERVRIGHRVGRLGPFQHRQVIGVVSAKIVGFGIEGVGYAISVNTVNTYLSRLKAGETIMTLD